MAENAKSHTFQWITDGKTGTAVARRKSTGEEVSISKDDIHPSLHNRVWPVAIKTLMQQRISDSPESRKIADLGELKSRLAIGKWGKDREGGIRLSKIHFAVARYLAEKHGKPEINGMVVHRLHQSGKWSEDQWTALSNSEGVRAAQAAIDSESAAADDLDLLDELDLS